MARARDYLMAKASAEQGTVTVSSMHGASITILGSSVPMSAVPGMQASAFSFSVEKGKKGLIAVHVMYREGKQYDNSSFFLPVDFMGEEPHVDLNNPWVPLRGRLGQVHQYGIEVSIRGKTFTTYDSKYDFLNEKYARDYRVSDPNIVCKYLEGDVGADAVIHVVTQQKVEERAAKRLPEVERELDERNQVLERVWCKLAQSEKDRTFLAESRQTLGREHRNLKSLVRTLKAGAERVWFKSNELKTAIANCPTE